MIEVEELNKEKYYEKYRTYVSTGNNIIVFSNRADRLSFLLNLWNV
jgi:hypothetical protein